MQGSIEKRGAVGIAWFDNPPVNAISHEVRQGLMAAVDAAVSDHEIKALIIIFCNYIPNATIFTRWKWNIVVNDVEKLGHFLR